jgi:hypothetical protein
MRADRVGVRQWLILNRCALADGRWVGVRTVLAALPFGTRPSVARTALDVLVAHGFLRYMEQPWRGAEDDLGYVQITMYGWRARCEARAGGPAGVRGHVARMVERWREGLPNERATVAKETAQSEESAAELTADVTRRTVAA